VIAGNEDFKGKTRNGIADTMTVSKVEKGKFIFTGWDIEKYEDMVTVTMKNYAKSLKDIMEIRKEDRHKKFTRIEMKEYRNFMNILSLITIGTRADLCYTVLKISQNNYSATIGDLHHVNKVLKKIKIRESEIYYEKFGRKE